MSLFFKKSHKSDKLRIIEEKIKAHPSAAMITAIIRGEKPSVGMLPLSLPEQAVFLKEPKTVADLNNLIANLHGGAYRQGWVFNMTKDLQEKPHLVAHLDILSAKPNPEELNLLSALGGYSHRFLAETPRQFWHNIDHVTAKVANKSAELFGIEFRATQATRTKNEFLLGEDNSGESDSRFQELQKARETWVQIMEPTILKIYDTLIQKGYTKRDLWT